MAALEATETVLEDTLTIGDGIIPKDWIKVNLNEGYYIGFPREPRQKERTGRIEWRLKRNKYEILVSIADLEQEPDFALDMEYRPEKEVYYQQILEDMAIPLEGVIEVAEPFLSQGVYEGMRAVITGEDFTLHTQLVIMGTELYSFALILFDESKPAYTQMREKFFHSFGKDMYIIEQQQEEYE